MMLIVQNQFLHENRETTLKNILIACVHVHMKNKRLQREDTK